MYLCITVSDKKWWVTIVFFLSMNCSQMLRGAFTEKCAIHFTDYKGYNNLKPFLKKANSGSKSYESVGRSKENCFHFNKCFRQKQRKRLLKNFLVAVTKNCIVWLVWLSRSFARVHNLFILGVCDQDVFEQAFPLFLPKTFVKIETVLVSSTDRLVAFRARVSLFLKKVLSCCNVDRKSVV